MRSATFIAASCLLLPACGPDDPAVPVDDSGESTSGSMGASGDGPIDSSTGAEVPEFAPYPARGIRLTDVFADHGVSVPIVRDGQWVDGSGRNAVLIAGRNTLIRGFWALDPGFQPRALESRLTLTYSDGREETASRTFRVEGDSDAFDLETTAYFIVPGELIEAGVKFQIELFETDNGLLGEPEPAQTAYPPNPELLGVEGTDMALRVVIVPVDHDLGPECPEPPAVTDEELQFLADQLYMQNPVQRVEVERRDPVAFTDSLRSFSALLVFLTELRGQDAADPGVYYYGVVNPCDGGESNVGGLAYLINPGPTMENQFLRVAMGRWYENSPSERANTFVHEIGHNQGRSHVACDGTEPGTDPSYPYDGGNIENFGFGSRDFTLHGPNSKDYMTYCGNYWVSDWGWQEVVPYIQEITSWDARSGRASTEGRVLLGVVDPATGHESWLETRGGIDGLGAEAYEEMTFVSAQGVTSLTTAAINPLSEGDAYMIVAPIPEGFVVEEGVSITRQMYADRRSVSNVKTAGQRVTLSD